MLREAEPWGEYTPVIWREKPVRELLYLQRQGQLRALPITVPRYRVKMFVLVWFMRGGGVWV